MKILSKLSFATLLTGAAMIVAPTASMASLISLNSLLSNPSFEGGLSGGCPIGWTCSNVGVTTPAPGLYPDPNGLTSPLVVPDGTFAAFTPVTGSNGVLRQSIAGESYAAGNTYTLDFWLGNPLGGLYPSRFDVQLLAGAFNSSQSNTLCDTAGRFSTLTSGAQSMNDNGTQCLFSLTTSPWQPADGDWRLYSLSFTTNANIVGDIGVQFTVFGQQSAENGVLMHLDLPGPQQITQVPEPATLALLGLAMAGMGAVRRRSAQT